jgi:hypothetical protein
MYWYDGIVYYLDYVLFKPVASSIPKCPTYKLLRLVQTLNRLLDLDEILYGGDGIEITSATYYLIT